MATPVPKRSVELATSACCPSEEHDALKANLGTFRVSTVYIGHQSAPGMLLELRRCLRCGTTLSMPADGEVRP